MFTGIITDIGKISAQEVRAGLTRLTIETAYDPAGIEIGASIACAGPCLTVVETGANWFAVELAPETLSRTTATGWQVGSRLNLERALRIGDELGGHLVTGHIDGVGAIVERRVDGEAIRFAFDVPAALSRFIAAKGSVALDGISLTVNEVEGNRFGVSLIPHTLEKTTAGDWQVGGSVNLEVDLMARYAQRLMAA